MPHHASKPKLLVILGPTASGKSDLAVEMARFIETEKIGGYAGAEIISADSRQVYIGLDIGTGKISAAEMKGVPHHLLDIVDPNDGRFTALDWKKHAERAIADITAKGKLPIICGGTGFYISTLIDDIGFPEVPADPVEQAALESLSAEELFRQLKDLDPKRAATIDLKNKRRLARAIIIARALGSVPELKSAIGHDDANNGPYDVLQIGTRLPDSELRERIASRLVRRVEIPNEDGSTMIKEAERLHAPKPHGAGLSYERMDELGLEYRYLAQFLQMKMSKEEMIETLSFKIWQYAKRQKTWWKKDARIAWFDPKDIDGIKNRLSSFLRKDKAVIERR